MSPRSCHPAVTLVLVALGLSAADLKAETTVTNSLGMRLTAIAPGSFSMGNTAGDFDEIPVHTVKLTKPFFIADSEVSWAQFEQFDPTHRRYRRDQPDEAAVRFVSWDDATRFCEWLGRKEGKTYRLPTEAEWEYVSRMQPALMRSAALADNWCHDWYGPYVADSQTDPIGYKDGDTRVTRGGTYRATNNTQHVSNRLSDLPADRNRAISFRVVQAELPTSAPLTQRPSRRWATNVSAKKHDWKPRVDMQKSFFAEPIPYVKIPAGMNGPLYHQHNHDPALTWCENGDLLAIWYSTIQEQGRELAIAASRLRLGREEWDEADLFWDVADRNDHAPSLLIAADSTIYQWVGLGVDYGWEELALVQRTSKDNGATWSTPRIIQPDHGLRNMPIPSAFQGKNGTLYLPCDAKSGGSGGTALHFSTDGGNTWAEPGRGKPDPGFLSGTTGDWIAGIHAGVAEWNDSLLAFGRGNNISNLMPQSVSRDGGRTWTYTASPFPPISGGQRPVLRRLREGPLLLISFARKGTEFTDAQGRSFAGQGLFAALSHDGGKTWPARKLVTDGLQRELNGQAWTKKFVINETQAEPKGYLTAAQTPDGMIHLISSGVYYRFNLAWVNQPNTVSATSNNPPRDGR